MSVYTELHLATSVLLTIDVQNDFTLAGAPGEVPGTRAAVPAMRRVVTAFRRAGLPIVHVVRLYHPDGCNADLPRREQIEAGTRLVAPGTAGARIVDGLGPDGEVDPDGELLLSGRLQSLGERERVMYKPRWGAFYATPLQEHLDELGVDSVVVSGCNFPNCPRTTIYEASERDYRIALITDATSGLYSRARTDMEQIGVHLLDTDACVEQLEQLDTTRSPSSSGWRQARPPQPPAATRALPHT